MRIFTLVSSLHIFKPHFRIISDPLYATSKCPIGLILLALRGLLTLEGRM
jgi:hypothetical protein